MATFQLEILGVQTMPDDTGNVIVDAYGNHDGGSAIMLPSIFSFLNQGTLNYLHGSFIVPQNYVGSPAIKALWSTTPTTGDYCWDFDYRAIADGESCDVTTAQESETTGSTSLSSYTARDLLVTSIGSLTAGNFSAGDLVFFRLGRDVATESSSIADELLLHKLIFEYTDA